MKKVLSVLLILCACVLLLTACQSNQTETKPAQPASQAEQAPAAEEAKPAAEEAKPAAEKADNKTLNVYNWGEYIDKEVITDFEKAFGVHINYTNFSSNEDMYIKQKANSYDIMIPSDYMIERLIKEKRLQAIDKSVVTNLDQLADGVKNMDFDPDNTYSVPYLWQTVGIVYDKTKVDPAKVEAKGWDIFLDAELDGKVYMYDSERDAFMVAFKALGYSANTEKEEEIQAAFEWLRNLDKTVHPSYVTDEVIDSMANGEKWLALVYSGDAAYILSQNENMAYCTPSQGTNVSVDAMVIPADAANPAMANQFIKYVLEYDNSLRISEEVGYASANAKVLADLSGEGGTYEGNEAYIPRSGYEKDEMFHDNEVLRKELSELWIKVKLHE